MKFLKAQVASLIGTIVDFFITLVSVELFGIWYVAGTFFGNLSGGITNFMLGRQWVFKAQGRNLHTQIFRYLIVWCGSIILNTSGVYLMTHYLTVQYIVSKIIVSLVIAFGYNYILQRYFVFNSSESEIKE